MAFTAKILLWRFRHLNIVGCLLKRRPTKGRGGTGTPGPPLATPLLLKIQIHVGSLKSGSIFRASRKVSVEYMNAEKRFRPKMF